MLSGPVQLARTYKNIKSRGSLIFILVPGTAIRMPGQHKLPAWLFDGRDVERSAAAAKRAAGPATALLERLEAAAEATGTQAEQAQEAVAQSRQQLQESVTAQRCALQVHCLLHVKIWQAIVAVCTRQSRLGTYLFGV